MFKSFCGHSVSACYLAILCLPVIFVRTLRTVDCAPREGCRGAKRSESLNYSYCINGEEQRI